MVLDSYRTRFYLFDQNVLHSIAKGAIEGKHNSTREMIHTLVANLNKRYPGHINTEEVNDRKPVSSMTNL